MIEQRRVEARLFRFLIIPALATACIMGVVKLGAGHELRKAVKEEARLSSVIRLNFRRIKIEHAGIYMSNKKPDNSFLKWVNSR